MFNILAAICVLFAPGSGIDGEGAVARAQRLLASLGGPEKSTLQALVDHHYITKQKCWSVSLTTERGAVTVVLDARTGRTLFLQTTPVAASAGAIDRSTTPENARHAYALLHKLGYDKDVKLGSAFDFSDGLCRVTFKRTVHHLPFFNLNPTYGHIMWFETQNGAINYFLPSPALPEVNTWTPQINSAAALTRLSEWGRARAKATHQEFVLTMNRRQVKPELGYWKFKGQSTARLVWRAVCYDHIQGHLYEAGTYGMFVDALTGELVAPDDPATGGLL